MLSCVWPNHISRARISIIFLFSFSGSSENGGTFVCECSLIKVKKIFQFFNDIGTKLEVRRFQMLKSVIIVFWNSQACLEIHTLYICTETELWIGLETWAERLNKSKRKHIVSPTWRTILESIRSYLNSKRKYWYQNDSGTPCSKEIWDTFIQSCFNTSSGLRKSVGGETTINVHLQIHCW